VQGLPLDKAPGPNGYSGLSIISIKFIPTKMYLIFAT
jgi:hypothetical protein